MGIWKCSNSWLSSRCRTIGYKMIITEAKYTLDMDGKNAGVVCKIDGVESNVPMDTDNRHYAEILKQVAEGKLTIKAAD